ncbi:hypothetical protein [Parapedobacter koreensis]|uniref:Uncharacterized protein n=1 Tax=Parapedobacter koreensis TaxID=332977 RepID=A0A1H7P146_9SPHI|nr:hypothetical protein [Parapedobacter koreensis]SEL29346.1 hypothetical protein SAMN05421740_104169 [Parapedobacter koreensis]
MMIPDNQKKPPVIPLDVTDTDETREPTGEDLRFNEAEDSFELDPETEDAEYQHPDPYDTAAPDGEDDNSTYDEENPYTPDEYRDKRSDLKGELEELDAEVAADEITQLDEADERLAETPEDERGDLDEEGYPLKDDAGGDNNPILENFDNTNDGPEDDEDGDDDVEVPPFDDPRRDDDEPIWDDPNNPLEPEDVPPVDERDPLGDKQIQSDDPTETRG